jgi:hypothetical protein
MRTLVIALASLALVGCGGLDETALPNQVSAENPAVEGIPPPPQEGHLAAPLPEPRADAVWALVWAREGIALQLVRVPVEERFFHPVDVNTPPPELPPVPCPDCR